ncbi:hypothetical protein BJV82DRAFT_602246 [Fennellomyces sp. T-0311]|nr:hypothetical protein BJV82DRAFT_602246 [Fennellomyces sp. T-0311]
MDDESRALIEQMLAEEEYYYGADTMSTLPTAKRKANKSTAASTKKIKPEPTISSASLPSHKTRWTSAEDEQLRSAIEQYGYGNWKSIAAQVQTRNPLQCKNRARHWVLSDKLEKQPSSVKDDSVPSPSASVPSQALGSPNASISRVHENKDNEDDEEISVEDDNGSPVPVRELILSPDEVRDNSKEEEGQAQQEMLPLEPDGVFVADQTVKTEQQMSEPSNEELVHAEKETVTQTEDPAIQGPPDPPSPEPATEPTNAVAPMVIYQFLAALPPIEAHQRIRLQFDRHNASNEEQQSNPEWFINKHSKTPDRYLKIRNHILDCWQQCQPRYLTKTSARRGLQNCGDVNAIGRVHSYLESIGAINVDCINSAPRQPPKRVPREPNHDEVNDDMFAAADLVIGYDGPRKRKVRNELGEWVDPRDLEGRVIEHGQAVKPARPKRIIKRSQHYDGYDPFRLVPLEYYDEEHSAPFIVDITSDALLIMDFHSHLAHTEIIGLLGGNFVESGGAKVLKVESVFPCRSTSTGIQCEMDPASEMKAREVFAEKGYSVVGWYHSHPTFEPHPSIRDIENQTSYQTLFRHESTGDEPFIGVIVTPYDTETVSDHSQIQYIHISSRWNEFNPFRIPYACKKMVHQSEQVSPQVFEEFEKLVHEFKDYEHKVNMLHTFVGSRTRLDKLLDSLRSNLFLPADQVTDYLERVRQLILSEYVNDTIGSSSLSPNLPDPSNKDGSSA